MLLGGTAFMVSAFKSDKIEASMIRAIRELSRVSLGSELNMEEAVHLYRAMTQAESSAMPLSVEIVGDSLKLVVVEEQQSISSSLTPEKRTQDALARACWDSPLLEGIRQQMQTLNRLTLTGEEKEIMERAKKDAIKVMSLHMLTRVRLKHLE